MKKLKKYEKKHVKKEITFNKNQHQNIFPGLTWIIISAEKKNDI